MSSNTESFKIRAKPDLFIYFRSLHNAKTIKAQILL